MTKVFPSSPRLVVLHYHLRPGGVRRIIELALPPILHSRESRFREVVIATGEAAGEHWLAELRARLPAAVDMDVFLEPAFHYFSECRRQPEILRRRIRAALEALLPADRAAETVVWAHNLGLARNLLLADTLRHVTRERRIRLLSHHHDFWFENRWARWAEMQACGFRTLSGMARAVFSLAPGQGFATINRLDQAVLQRTMPRRAFWIPNLVSRPKPLAKTRTRRARETLSRLLGDEAPVWLVPTRFLRRKNLAEAVLLTRWLRPDGWLVTTAGVSSPDEKSYARRLDQAARQGNWRVRFRFLDDRHNTDIGFDDVVAAAEVLLLTSVQEGFGLPYLEASAAGKPLLARRLPNVSPDLKSLGFRFPHLYEDVWIAPELLNVPAEQARQNTLWRKWKSALPAVCRRLAAPLWLSELEPGVPLPFSRLTLTGQLEVLRHPPADSWRVCKTWNPRLRRWMVAAGNSRLQVAEWPQSADARIGAAAYAERFHQTLRDLPDEAVSSKTATRVQKDFLIQRLGRDFLYPILMEQ